LANTVSLYINQLICLPIHVLCNMHALPSPDGGCHFGWYNAILALADTISSYLDQPILWNHHVWSYRLIQCNVCIGWHSIIIFGSADTMKLSCVIISADTMQCLDWPTRYYRIWISRYYKTIMCDYIGQCNPIVNTVWANPIDWYRSIKYNWIWTNQPTRYAIDP